MARDRFFAPACLSVLALVMACTPEPITNVEVGPFAGDPYPDGVEDIAYPVGPSALVTDSYSDTVSVVDLVSGVRIGTRPVGRNPVDIDGPHHLALDAERGFAYIALSYPKIGGTGPHASHGSSVSYGYVQKLALADLSVLGQVRVDPNPGDIAVSEDGKRVVTSHFDLQRAVDNADDYEKAKATIAIVDPTQLELEGSPAATLITTCVAPHGMQLTKPSASLVYLACYGEDRIAVIDTEEPGSPPELIDVGAGVSGFGSPVYGPYALRLNADESRLVVSNTASKDVRFFDTASQTFDSAATIITLGAPFFVDYSADESKLYIPTQQPNALLVVDLTGVEETVTRTFTDDECRLPHVVEELDGNVFIVCEGDHEGPGNVLALDADLEVLSNTPVGVYPDSISILAEVQR
jgi:DNA-binding beta-propeller fold protein YncE